MGGPARGLITREGIMAAWKDRGQKRETYSVLCGGGPDCEGCATEANPVPAEWRVTFYRGTLALGTYLYCRSCRARDVAAYVA